MFFTSLVVALAAAMTTASAKVPHLAVPQCPSTGSVEYSKSVPEQADFPLTKVDLCYDEKSIQITFTALNETNFFYNETQGTNDPIWMYEVMEAFIYQGTADPRTYFEYEISPNNVTFQAFIYNPSKVRTEGAPFDAFFVADPFTDGLSAETTLDEASETWVSTARIPLGLFNVEDGCGRGTEWRMNFFRTVTSPETYPDQLLGAWSPPNQPSFHMTPFFGHVRFV